MILLFGFFVPPTLTEIDAFIELLPVLTPYLNRIDELPSTASMGSFKSSYEGVHLIPIVHVLVS